MPHYLEKIGLPVFDESIRKRVQRSRRDHQVCRQDRREAARLFPLISMGSSSKSMSFKYHPTAGRDGKSSALGRCLQICSRAGADAHSRDHSPSRQHGVLTPVAELEPVFLPGARLRAPHCTTKKKWSAKISAWAMGHHRKRGRCDPEGGRSRLKNGAARIPIPGKCQNVPQLRHLLSKRRRGRRPLSQTRGCARAADAPDHAYFASKDAMDIEHLGEKVVEQLCREKSSSRTFPIFIPSQQKISPNSKALRKNRSRISSPASKSPNIPHCRASSSLSVSNRSERRAQSFWLPMLAISTLCKKWVSMISSLSKEWGNHSQRDRGVFWKSFPRRRWNSLGRE